MNSLIISIFILAFASVSFAKEFQSIATYCNGPVLDGDTATCPAFSNWQGVSLKNLSSVNIPVSKTEQLLRLEDSSGSSWEIQLSSCQSKITAIRGCNAVANFSDAKLISIHISIWDIGTQQKNLSLFINNDNSLNIISAEGDELIFQLQ